MIASKPADPDGHVHQPAAKGAPVGVGDHQADAPAHRRRDARLKRRAEASGSRGSRITAPSGVLEASMPALAHTNPWWVSQITVAPRWRTTRRLSERIRAHSAGSLPVCSASAQRVGAGHDRRQSARCAPRPCSRPSGPPSRRRPGTTPSARARSASIPARSSPGATSGSADSGQILRGRSRPRAGWRSPGARTPRGWRRLVGGHQGGQVARRVDVESHARQRPGARGAAAAAPPGPCGAPASRGRAGAPAP